MTFLFAPVIAVLSLGQGEAFKESHAARSPKERLGERLFLDNRLSNPGSNFAASCRSCHLPPWAPEGKRAYADVRDLSLTPSNERGGVLTTKFNTPTLLDVGEAKRFFHDGSAETLEAAVDRELTSTHMGWLPGERERALNEFYAQVVYDVGEDNIAEGSYAEQFKAAYGVDIESMEAEEVMSAVVTALSDFVRSLRASRGSPYDRFMAENDLPSKPRDGQPVSDYAEALMHALETLEANGSVTMPDGFSREALAGLKVFFETKEGGACVLCHVPHRFTDDALHGSVLHSSAVVPSAEIKTPPLRNLRYTDPYGHDGRITRLAEVLEKKRQAGRGEAEPDAELDAASIMHLEAFLDTLNDTL